MCDPAARDGHVPAPASSPPSPNDLTATLPPSVTNPTSSAGVPQPPPTTTALSSAPSASVTPRLSTNTRDLLDAFENRSSGNGANDGGHRSRASSSAVVDDPLSRSVSSASAVSSIADGRSSTPHVTASNVIDGDMETDDIIDDDDIPNNNTDLAEVDSTSIENDVAVAVISNDNLHYHPQASTPTASLGSTTLHAPLLPTVATDNNTQHPIPDNATHNSTNNVAELTNVSTTITTTTTTTTTNDQVDTESDADIVADTPPRTELSFSPISHPRHASASPSDVRAHHHNNHQHQTTTSQQPIAQSAIEAPRPQLPSSSSPKRKKSILSPGRTGGLTKSSSLEQSQVPSAVFIPTTNDNGVVTPHSESPRNVSPSLRSIATATPIPHQHQSLPSSPTRGGSESPSNSRATVPTSSRAAGASHRRTASSSSTTAQAAAATSGAASPTDSASQSPKTTHKRPHFQSLVGIPSLRSPLYTAESVATMVPQLVDAMVGSLPTDAWDWHSGTTSGATGGASAASHSSEDVSSSNMHDTSSQTLRFDIDTKAGSAATSLQASSFMVPPSPTLTPALSADARTVESVLQRDDRGYVVWNLVETERNYVQQLGVLIRFFREKMLNDRIIAEPASNLIFAGVEELLDFHKVFLVELEDLVAVNHWNTKTSLVGSFFMRNKDTLVKLYTYFIDSYAMSQKSIKREEKENPVYVQFMKEAVKLKDTGRQQLKDFLILPVQRTARYHLILKDLMKRTDPQHPDYQNLNNAWEAMNELAASVNEKKRQEEQQSGLFEAFEQTKNCPPTLIKHSRKLIFTVDVVDQKSSKPLRLFLCSDLLMIASIHGRGVLPFGRNAAEPGYKFVRWLDLLEIRIDEGEELKPVGLQGVRGISTSALNIILDPRSRSQDRSQDTPSKDARGFVTQASQATNTTSMSQTTDGSDYFRGRSNTASTASSATQLGHVNGMSNSPDHASTMPIHSGVLGRGAGAAFMLANSHTQSPAVASPSSITSASDMSTPTGNGSIHSASTMSPADHSAGGVLNSTPVLGKEMVRVIHDPAYRDPTDSFTQPVEGGITMYTFKFDGAKNHKDFCMALQSEIKKNVELRRGGKQFKFSSDGTVLQNEHNDISSITQA